MTENNPTPQLRDMAIPLKDLVICIKGAGEMATGVAWRLYSANFRHIFMLETAHPRAVRRRVSFCEAVHDGTATVEGVTAVRTDSPREVPRVWDAGRIPVLVDPAWEAIPVLTPHVTVDAIIAKRNLGTRLSEASLTIGLGPGFTAGEDVHAVVETNRGHHLGRVIRSGSAEPNTGVPGTIAGFSLERLLRAPCNGTFRPLLSIGDRVETGTLVGYVDEAEVRAAVGGVIRGLIRDGSRVPKGLKIGDVDPRGQTAFVPVISEKARSIGGGVLEAILAEYNR